MRNSNILFLVAVVILVWFGSEVFVAQEICATSCISLSGLSIWEQGVSVIVLPVLLIIGGIRAKRTEDKNLRTKRAE